MSWVETIQKAVPWVSGLPLVPKIVVSLIVVLIAALFLLLVWRAPAEVAPSTNPEVVQAYDRMKKVLARLRASDKGAVELDGMPFSDIAWEYWKHYLAIAEYVREHPGDVDGAYEEVWAHGGPSRTFVIDTEEFETVVSAFFGAYEEAKAQPTQNGGRQTSAPTD